MTFIYYSRSQDKYDAYFLQLESEKNQTQEVLSEWKAKRDAEVVIRSRDICKCNDCTIDTIV